MDGSPESALLWIGSLRDNFAIVFDNADALTPEELEGYFPPGLGGNILITSRNSAMQCLTSPEDSLEVGEMERSDAMLLLLKAACLDTSRTDLKVEASEIVKELCGIPLAIDQAGAFIASGATNIRNYLPKYFQHRKSLLSHSEFKGASKYNRNVYGTWELSYKEIQLRAESNNPDKAKAAQTAMHILALFAFLHYDGIIEDIFSYAAVQQQKRDAHKNLVLGLAHAGALLDCTLLPLNESGTWDDFIFKEGLRVLLSFCLIKLGPCDGAYSVHPLIHAWGRDRMSLAEKKKYGTMAYAVLLGSLHQNFKMQPYAFRRVLVTHIRANIQYSKAASQGDGDSYFDDGHSRFSMLLFEQGYSIEAQNLAIQVVEMRNKTLGEEHEDTISAMANLSVIYEAVGKFTQAEKLASQVLKMGQKLFGEKHQNTIDAKASLAIIYNTLGRYSETEKLQTQVLDARINILGENHPDTIMALENLAATYSTLRKYVEVEKLEIQILNAREILLGEEHLDTIRSITNLAKTCRALKKYKEAEELHIRALEISDSILDEQCPSLRSMQRIAENHRDLGQYKKAEMIQRRILHTSTRLLGEHHQSTIKAMENLAETLRDLEKYPEAEKLEIQVLDGRNGLLGADHPETIKVMSNLAETYKFLGKYLEAKKLLIQVVDARMSSLGEKHLETIKAMAKLAEVCSNLHNYTDAENLQIQVLDAWNSHFGLKDPETIRAMENLAETYKLLGKFSEVEELHSKVLDLKNSVYEVKH